MHFDPARHAGGRPRTPARVSERSDPPPPNLPGRGTSLGERRGAPRVAPPLPNVPEPPSHVIIRAEYDRAAAGYDRRWARYNRASLALLRPWIAGRELGRVVDVGSGTGNLLPFLAECGARVDAYAGLDLSPEMLRVARGKGSGVGVDTGFVAADAEKLPLRDASFDTAVSASVLHYWEDAAAALDEIRRVLRPAGRLLLIDWLRDPVPMRLLNAWMRITRLRYHRMYSRDELADVLAVAGFRVYAEARGNAGGPWRLIAIDARPA
jgi:ubiquinone/menaquinone biosynthesis C-methylase UbiE